MPVQKQRKAPQPKKAAMPTEEQIRQRAYEIFLARGATSGDPQADWDEAVRELTKPKPTKR